MELPRKLYCQSCADELFASIKKTVNYVANWYFLWSFIESEEMKWE